MNISDTLFSILRAFISLAALLAWFLYARRRGGLERDAALLGSATAALFWVLSASSLSNAWQVVGIALAGVHPVLLVHLLGRFQPVSLIVRAGVYLGAFLTIPLGLAQLTLAPPTGWLIGSAALYWLVAESAFCVAALATSSRVRPPRRWRYALIACSLLFISLFLGLLAIESLFMPAAVGGALMFMLPVLLAGNLLMFGIGVYTPRRLLEWQLLHEARGLTDGMTEALAQQRQEALPGILLSKVQELIGGLPLLARHSSAQEGYILHRLHGEQAVMARSALERLFANDAPAYYPMTAPAVSAPLQAIGQEVAARGLYMAPLVQGGVNYGALLLFLPQVPQFAAEELRLLSILSDHTASLFAVEQLVTSQEKVLRDAQRQSRQNQQQAQLLAEISHAGLDRHAIAAAAARALSTHIGDGAMVCLVEREGEPPQATACYHPDEEICAQIRAAFSLRRENTLDGVSAQAIEFRKAISLSHGESDNGLPRDHFALAQTIKIQSSLHVPLLIGARLVGLMRLFRNESVTPYGHDDLRLIERFGERLALALENAALFEQAQREVVERTRAERALRASENRLAEMLSLAPHAVISVEESGRIAGYNAEAERIFGYNPGEVKGQALALLCSIDPVHRRDILKQVQAAPSGGVVSTNQKPLFWRRRDGSLFPGALHASLIKQRGGNIRTLIVRDITNELRVQQESRKRTQILATLYASTLTLMDRLHVADSLEMILRRAGQLLETGHGYVALTSPDGTHMEIKIGVGNFRESVGYEVEAGAGITGWVWQTGELLYVNDYETWEHRTETVCAEGIRAAITIPLFAERDIVGVLGLAHFEPNRTFDDEDIELLNLFAPLASIALYNAQLFAEVERLAKTDDLTGLLNRRAFIQRAESLFAEARQDGQPLAAIMLDIDHFKRVNDTYGHTRGDEILRWVATECRKLLRSRDILARYGGEEFALLLPGTTQAEAFRLAEQIRVHIAFHPVPIERTAVRVSLSLGVAILSREMNSVNDLLHIADSRLYGAKAQGRNQVVDSDVPNPMYFR